MLTPSVLLNIGLNHYLFLSAIIFTIGILTVLLRKNLIVILMGIELMLNAVNLTFIAFSHYSNNINGPVIVFFVMTLAAAEAGVGLALMVTIFKKYKRVDLSNFEKLKN
jgi:NADH-quinone oxidoreductase subunit K